MRKNLIFLLVLALPILAIAQDKLTVVTPHETIESMVESVGGDYVEVIALASGTRDPHYVPAKPSFISKARRADLWVRYGMEMEIGYERLILEGSRNANIQVGNMGHLDLSRNVYKMEIPHGPVDRSMGDIHPLGNPHYWLDPYNGRIMVRDIAGRLAELLPSQSEYFIERGEELVRSIDQAMFGAKAMENAEGDLLWEQMLAGTLEDSNIQSGWYSRLKPHAGKSFISYHKSFTYLANRFGLEVPIELEPKPGIPPGPRHVLNVVRTIKGNDVKLIMQAPYYDRSAADSAASKTGIKVVLAPTSVGGTEKATSYVELIETLVSILENNL